MSCSDAVNLVDEPDLPDNIALREPADLTFSDHVHRLISRDCFQRAAYRPKPEAGGNSLLNETMILFQDIVHVLRWPAAAPPPRLPRLLQFRHGCGIGGMSVDVDDSRPVRCNANCKKCLAATISRLGDNMRSMVSRAESTARYKYTQFPATRTYVPSTRQDRFGCRRSRRSS
jgi:hypothetical protein